MTTTSSRFSYTNDEFFPFFSVYECQKSPVSHAKTAQYHITQQIWYTDLFCSYRCIAWFFSYTNVEYSFFFLFPVYEYVKRALYLMPKQPNIISRSKDDVLIDCFRTIRRSNDFFFPPVYECKKEPCVCCQRHSGYNACDISYWHVMFYFHRYTTILDPWCLFPYLCAHRHWHSNALDKYYEHIMHILMITPRYSTLFVDSFFCVFPHLGPIWVPPPICVPIGTEATMHLTNVINIFCVFWYTHHDNRHFCVHFFFFPIWVPNGIEDTEHSTYIFRNILNTLLLLLFFHICVPIGIDAIMHWTNIINILCIFGKIHRNTRHFLFTLFFDTFYSLFPPPPIWVPNGTEATMHSIYSLDILYILDILCVFWCIHHDTWLYLLFLFPPHLRAHRHWHYNTFDKYD